MDTTRRDMVFMEHLPRDGPPEFVIDIPGVGRATIDVTGVLALQGAASDFILAHSPMVLRDGTTLPKTVRARFETPRDFLALNIPAGTGH